MMATGKAIKTIKAMPFTSAEDALRKVGVAMQSMTSSKPIPTVNPYPCEATSDDYNKGPVLADNRFGLASGEKVGTRTQPKNITWEGITWRIVEDSSGILWVLCASRDMVECRRDQFTRLAIACRDYGGLENVIAELRRGPLIPRAEGAKPKSTTKRLALNAITEAVKDAYAAGATAQEVRMAVMSALGLDSDTVQE